MRVEEGFHQTPYPDEHPYTTDPVLPGLIKRILPVNIRHELDRDLARLGNVLVTDIRPLAPLVHPATFVQYNEWGQRVDRLHTSEGWRELETFAIKEGYSAIAYERKYGEHSRIFQFARTMVMTGDCHAIMCPMGMTDGAARLVELFGTDDMKKELLPRFLSRDPAIAFLSGQWMTERPGGSDISLTETCAIATQRLSTDLGEPYILDGFKWFSSAAEGNMAVALARTGDVGQGSRGLSLFLVPLRMGPYATPLSNGVLMHRLKNKVGTHGVPTAELELRGTRAWLVGPINEGVRCIALMLNITRIHSAAHSVGSLQRCLAIARAYAGVRPTKGGNTLLKDVPLHVAGLANIALLHRALTYVVFGAIALLGKSECGKASVEEEARLRMLTPTIKAYAAEWATSGMEQAMGALGGLGYMEETGIGRLIRDAMVEKIWEGTTNICGLDLTRGHEGPGSDLILHSAPAPLQQHVGDAFKMLSTALEKLPAYFRESATNPLLPCVVLNYFAIISCALYLLEHATWAYAGNEPSREADIEAFRRWVEEGDLTKVEGEIASARGDFRARAEMNLKLVYGTGEHVHAKL
ncbi:acyl-CoA dehydrogenase NM domain-like protein [Daedaleopsis nitida]|nr:acyl-CoA dehydrogenase NM domain-like protein [Daedaleopsis nitida]